MQTCLRPKELDMNQGAESKTEQIQSITRGYARFSRNAAGLGNVLGGLLVLAGFLAPAIPGFSTPGRTAVAMFPLVWLVCRELLRRHYYQRFGKVTEPQTDKAKRGRILMVAFLSLISVGIIVAVVMAALRGKQLDLRMVPYLLFVAAVPVAYWFFMWSSEDTCNGIMLLCLAAVLSAGGSYLKWEFVWIPFLGLVSVAVGLKQHMQFRELETQIRLAKAAQ